MSKNLPYFKFYVSEWSHGDITLCSMEAQGLFINICSLYFSKQGVLSYSKIQKRYDRNTNALQELTDENIIEVNDDLITIRFLDEQLEERDIRSEQNRLNVLKRWKKYDRNTTVIQNDTIKRRGEEKREEKKRKERVIFPFDSDDFKNYWSVWKEYKKKEHRFNYKTAISEQAALKKLSELSNTNESDAIRIIIQSIENGWKGFFTTQKNGKEQTTDSDIERVIADKHGYQAST